MRPIRHAAALRRYWPVPVVLSLVGMLLLTLAGWQRHRPHEAGVRLVATFDAPLQATGAPASATEDGRLEMFRVRGYTQRAASITVARVVVETLHLDIDPDDLAASVHASTPLDTHDIDIAVRHVNPVLAVRVCNAIAAELVRLASAETPGPTVPRISLSIAEPSVVARPVRSATWVYPAAGLVGGLLVGVGSAVLWAERERCAHPGPTLTARS